MTIRYEPDRVLTSGGQSKHLHTDRAYGWRIRGRTATAQYANNPDAVHGWYRRVLKDLIKMIKAIRSDISNQEVVEAMVTGNIETLMRKIEAAAVATLPSLLSTVQTDAVRDMLEWGKGLRLIKDVGVTNQIINQRTAYRNEQAAMELVREFRNEQRQVLNQATGLKAIKDRILETGQPTEFLGQNPRELAARTFDGGKIKKRIGLTAYQWRSVDRVEAMLQDRDYDSLTANRPLFDKDLQERVSPYKTVGDDGRYKPMPKRVRDQIVTQYTDNKIVHRLETIARTEMLRNVNMGKNDAWQMMIDTGETQRDWWQPTWDSSLDNRVRDSHKAPLHGQVMGTVVPNGFQTNEGNFCLFPTDPILPPEDSINCRCQVLYRLEVPVDTLLADVPGIDEAFPA